MRRASARRLGAAVLIVGIALVLPPVPASAASPHEKIAPPKDGSGAAVPDGWIVTLKPDAEPAKAAPGLARAAGGSVTHVYRHALHGFAFKGSAKAAAALLHNPNVRTVVPDHTIHATADTIPTGVSRIQASHSTPPSAFSAGFTGAGIRVAILDTGIDLTHPDLVANIDAGLGLNCMGAGPPQDGHGHGTHVAGIAAAAVNGLGVVGVAPSAHLVPIKVLDDTGSGEWSNLICAIDYLTALDTDGDPTNDVRVANMSLGDTGSIGTCTDGGVREAICTLRRGRRHLHGCRGQLDGRRIDLHPGGVPRGHHGLGADRPRWRAGWARRLLALLHLLRRHARRVQQLRRDRRDRAWVLGSTRPGPAAATRPRMGRAWPHRTSRAWRRSSRRPTQSFMPADVEQLLKATGECPNGQPTDGRRQLRRQGSVDERSGRDRGATRQRPSKRPARRDWDPFPTVKITNPTDGSIDLGVVNGHRDRGGRQRCHQGRLLHQWDAGLDRQQRGRRLVIHLEHEPARRWDVHAHCHGDRHSRPDGHRSGHRPGRDERPGQLGRHVRRRRLRPRCLECAEHGPVKPAGRCDLQPRAGDALQLDDLDDDDRRARPPEPGPDRAPGDDLVRHDRGAGPPQLRQPVQRHAPSLCRRLGRHRSRRERHRRRRDRPSNGRPHIRFNNGAWVHVPITVGSGGSVLITADNTAGTFNAVLNGLFLGGAGTPPPPPPPPPPPTTDIPGVQGNWVGTYGVDGYVLGAWNAPSTDLSSLPAGVTYSLEQGTRYSWTTSTTTTDVRALQSPDQTERRATTWYDATEVRVRLNFANPYSGTLHLYAVDWNAIGRAENVTVDDGTGPRTVGLTSLQQRRLGPRPDHRRLGWLGADHGPQHRGHLQRGPQRPVPRAEPARHAPPPAWPRAPARRRTAPRPDDHLRPYKISRAPARDGLGTTDVHRCPDDHIGEPARDRRSSLRRAGRASPRTATVGWHHGADDDRTDGRTSTPARVTSDTATASGAGLTSDQATADRHGGGDLRHQPGQERQPDDVQRRRPDASPTATRSPTPAT